MNIHNLPKYGYEGATRDDWDTYDIGWFITLDLIGLTTIGEIGGVSKLLPPCIVCGIKRECFTVKGTANRNSNTTRKNHYERLSIIIPIFLKQFCPQNKSKCFSMQFCTEAFSKLNHSYHSSNSKYSFGKYLRHYSKPTFSETNKKHISLPNHLANSSNLIQ